MEESSSNSIDNTEEVMGAAKQLMQLSNDDDNSTNVVAATDNKIENHGGGEEEVDQKRCQIETSIWLKIEEIFGREEEEKEVKDREVCDDSIFRPKKRRFRSIQSIYMKTKPVVNRRFSGKGIVGT